MTFKHRILGHDLEFKYLNWEEDPGVSDIEEHLGKALVSIDGHLLSREDAKVIVNSLLGKTLYGLWILYQGSYPEARTWEIGDLWSAPKIKVVDRVNIPNGEEGGDSE